MNKKRKPSIDQRVTQIIVLFCLASAISIAIFMTAIIQVKNGQKDFENDRVIRSLVAEIKNEFSAMESSDYGYISNPTNESMLARKLIADGKVEELTKELNNFTKDPMVLEAINSVLELDDNVMDPMSAKALSLVETNRPAMTRLYELKIMPGYGFAQLKLGRLITKLNERETLTRDRMVSVSQFSVIALGIMIPLMAVLGIMLIWRLRKAVVGPLESAVNSLLQQAQATTLSSQGVTEASLELARSTAVQASAVQQTAASIEEMTAMIRKNAENAQKSTQTAHHSSAVATRGQLSADEVISSIHSISEANLGIHKQMAESNRKMGEITRVISEIGDKTKVINDIVFQTKLLSFNASVEAARAGEHGKGFAIVAEEVGNLALMSGTAAKEINHMLASSIEKVESIEKTTRSSIEHLLGGAQAKISSGVKVAESTGSVLHEIVEKVNEVNLMVSDITSATQEQAQGVEEINKAIMQLDDVAQTNNKVTQVITQSATELGDQAAGLENLASRLYEIVRGVQREKKSA